MDKEISTNYGHFFKQVEKFMLSSDVKDERKTWDTPQKKTWILRTPNCLTCGNNLTVDTITREHIFPLVLGGKESDDNIIPLCEPCNKKRNDLMTISIGSNVLATLRKRWPANRTSIEEFLVWCHATINQDTKTIEKFPHLNQTFAELRSIKNKYAITATSKSKNSTLAKGMSWFRSKTSNIFKKPVINEKISINCPEQKCVKTLKIPINYQGKFRCPKCKVVGYYPQSTEMPNSVIEVSSETSTAVNQSIDDKTTNSEKKKESKKENDFELESWLSKNWHGLESAASSYIELKLAISANEKGKKKRAVRIVLEEDYGLSKTMALEKMYQRLDDLFNSNNIENNSTQKKEKETVTKSSSLNGQKLTQQNQNKIEELKSEFIQTIIKKLESEENVTLAHIPVFLNSTLLPQSGFEKWTDFKKEMGYSNNTKLVNIIEDLLREKVEIIRDNTKITISLKQEKLPTAEQESERLRKEFIEIVYTKIKDVERLHINNLFSPWNSTSWYQSGFKGWKEFKKAMGFSNSRSLTAIVEELVGEKVNIIHEGTIVFISLK